MKKNYTFSLLTLSAVFLICSQSIAQKKQTITIINGDTTISEGTISPKEMVEIEKRVNISMNDQNDSGKTIVKKIIIREGDMKDKEVMAYAYSFDESDEDIQITIDEKGNEKRIVTRKSGESIDDKKTDKKIIREKVISPDSPTGSSSSRISLNIEVKEKTIKLDIEAGEKEPLNVSLLDENGKQIFYDSKKEGGKYRKEIKLEKKGTYFLNIIQNKKSTTEKIIVE
ncbi:MAG: T9SS type A sorting domain-containing protein [Bacteroidota bacterium]|nr:T9SS type A sorting domain-containing protein [Bacteroidota bacterium]